MSFYAYVLRRLLDEGKITTSSRTLAVCAGPVDADALHEAGFTDVTISNLDGRVDWDLQGYKWERGDTEALHYADGSFDFVVVHAGLHHCAYPARALGEMYRVTKQGALVLEARDSLLIRAAAKLGLTEEYERSAVAFHNYKFGGLRNLPVPNYIYRWTEREVRKTIESAFPDIQNEYRFFYGLRLPEPRTAGKRTIVKSLGLVAKVFRLVLPKQCNQFAFFVSRNGQKAWMDGAVMRRDPSLYTNPSAVTE
jgi:Methylase involved in ubiquinone/menaquinone biosynthesis|nr:class I SAM-dependent methyltransferase [uncultured Steroidobacter sp.]